MKSILDQADALSANHAAVTQLASSLRQVGAGRAAASSTMGSLCVLRQRSPTGLPWSIVASSATQREPAAHFVHKYGVRNPVDFSTGRFGVLGDAGEQGFPAISLGVSPKAHFSLSGRSLKSSKSSISMFNNAPDEQGEHDEVQEEAQHRWKIAIGSRSDSQGKMSIGSRIGSRGTVAIGSRTDPRGKVAIAAIGEQLLQHRLQEPISVPVFLQHRSQEPNVDIPVLSTRQKQR